VQVDSTLHVASYKTVQRPAALPGVEILRGRQARNADGGGFFTQYAVAAGDGPIQLHHNGKPCQFAGRYVVLVNPGDFIPTHACGGDIVFQTWCFDPGLMREAAAECGQSRAPRFIWGIAKDNRLHSMITSAAMTLARTRDALEQQDTMTGLLDVLLGSYVDQGGH
jgi:hypothetical protein